MELLVLRWGFSNAVTLDGTDCWFLIWDAFQRELAEGCYSCHPSGLLSKGIIILKCLWDCPKKPRQMNRLAAEFSLWLRRVILTPCESTSDAPRERNTTWRGLPTILVWLLPTTESQEIEVERQNGNRIRSVTHKSHFLF